MVNVLFLLGLDIGTTSCKAGIFNRSGKLLSFAYREYELSHPKPDWSEENPDEIWDKIKISIKESLNLARAGEKIKSVDIKAL